MAAASALNMTSLLNALESTEKSGIQMADELTTLKGSLEGRTYSYHSAKYTRKQNAIIEKITDIERKLTLLNNRLRDTFARRRRAARNSGMMMEIVEGDNKVILDSHAEMKRLSDNLGDLRRKLSEIRQEAESEAKKAASNARELAKAEATLERKQKAFNSHFNHNLSNITSMMRKPWRRRDNNNNQTHNRHGSPRRPSGGATRRRYRKRNVTRRR